MEKYKVIFFTIFVFICVQNVSHGSEQKQFGLGYSREFRKNTDIAQTEFFFRYPLALKKSQGSRWSYSSAMEFKAALLHNSDTNKTESGSFSLMPQMFFSTGNGLSLFAGFGAGYILGDTEFSDHNLGGEFFLSSKLGIQLLLGNQWGAEYAFYHQSNADVYDNNDGLNMHSISVVYRF